MCLGLHFRISTTSTKGQWVNSFRPFRSCWPQLGPMLAPWILLYCLKKCNYNAVAFCINYTCAGPIFCHLLGKSSDYAQPITCQVTEVTCPVIGWPQPELTPSKRQKTGPGLLTSKICFGRVGSGDSGLWCSWDGDWASIVSASSSRFAGASCSWPAWTRRLIRSSWRSTNRWVSARKTELQCVSNELTSFLH